MRRVKAVAYILAAFIYTGILAVIILLPLVLLLLIPGSACLRGKMTYMYARWLWATGVSWIVGVRYEIRGKSLLPKIGAPIYVANHQSIFDFFALMWLIPQAAFVAKKEIDWIRAFLVGMVVSLANQIRIDRGNGPGAMEKIIRFAKEFPDCPIIIFAQGTRSSDTQTKPFKHGAATLAIETGRTPVPIRITGTWDITKDGWSGWLDLRRGHGVIVEACEPISVENKNDSMCLTRQIECVIVAKGQEHMRHRYGARCISRVPYDQECLQARHVVPH